MEPFVDGGFFEILIALALGYVVNYIFLKKYLLIVYSGVAILTPILLTLIPKHELYYVVASVCFLNSILLVILLWREKNRDPGSKLFSLKRAKKSTPSS